MPYSVVDKPSSYFNTVTYAGTSATNNISVGFEPDFVWIKNRTDAFAPYLSDSVRGVHKILFSNLTNAEYDGTSNSDGVSAFTSTGFTLLNGVNADNYNKTANNYVAWNWRGSDSSAVTNTSGSITSTVSANTTSGFSIVTYTGAGVVASTVGHGLAVAPKLIIIKSRSNSTNWILGHNSLGWNKYMALNTTDAVETNNYFNDTAPTSSVFSVAFSTNVNGSGYTYVAYCFAEVKGFSKFGSYVGNGSTNGTFVYTGFTPAFVIFKSSSLGTTNWQLLDNKRNTFNPQNNHLRPNGSGAEFTNYPVDFLSNGFKFRNTDGDNNQSGATYIYMCFASNPFVSSKGIAVTAR